MQALTEMLLSEGTSLVGYGDLGELPADVRHAMLLGISIAVALDPTVIAGIRVGPSQAYYAEYNRANDLLDRLSAVAAGFLQGHGYRAVALAATNVGIDPATHSTRLPHKTVATRAGLGWIGKCALLVTERFGSAVRLGAVLTDAELPAGESVDVSTCGNCVACVEVCPGRAATGKEWQAGTHRDTFFDAWACRRAARQMAAKAGIDATVCGMCIAACPWTMRYIDG